MFPHKREAGIVVIERGIAPSAGRMAGATICTELTIMSILRSMTRITIRWCPLVHPIGMTCIALNVRVSS